MFKPAPRSNKVSHHVIEQIRDAILTGEFKPGDRLASQRELIDQFQVSKASMREALTVLEGMGLIEARKGTGGGIFAAEVDMKTTALSLTNFLHFKNVSVGDITMVRYFLEPHLAEFALSRMTKNDIRILETMTSDEVNASSAKEKQGIGFHYYIARFSDNPLLILLMDFIESLLADLKVTLNPGPEFYDEVKQDHHKIMACFRRKDSVNVKKEMAAHVLRVGNHMATLAETTPFTPSSFERDHFLYTEAGLTTDRHISGNESPLPPEARKSLQELGVLLRHVGQRDLYFVQVKDELHAQRRRKK
ncbi:MAG TPA: GntR family transcriptional regulator [Desulfomonilaceae bacterium]|nr:GntR family transcriptional regulator [Desulfomonilaceae bacterium]